MTISFPYPQMGTVRRDPGQGCTTCVHNVYCQAYYWLRRYAIEPGMDDHLGIQCAEWSDDPAERITDITQADLDENDRLNDDGILVEPFRNGITDPVTGNSRKFT